MVMALVLINGLALASNIIESLNNTDIAEYNNQALQAYMQGQQITPTSTISIGLSYILHFDSLDATVNATTSGNITTASVAWKDNDGNTIETETLTMGTPITTMKSHFATITITNPVATTINITGNIRAIDD